MVVRQVKVISKTDCHGRQCLCGFVDIETEVVGVSSYVLSILDMEDDSDPWVLGWPTQISSLTTEALNTIISGEERRKALGSLSDEQLALLGVTRD